MASPIVKRRGWLHPPRQSSNFRERTMAVRSICRKFHDRAPEFPWEWDSGISVSQFLRLNTLEEVPSPLDDSVELLIRADVEPPEAIEELSQVLNG
ncbi:hypothetical protein VT03_11125 [Planctomyces sp. SH-PL14]|nr:hypothetical protein VT03_11125 [Planctomyces sp. SH-PL14]